MMGLAESVDAVSLASLRAMIADNCTLCDLRGGADLCDLRGGADRCDLRGGADRCVLWRVLNMACMAGDPRLHVFAKVYAAEPLPSWEELVAMVLKGSGWEIVDMGVDVPAEKFVEAARENPGCVIGLSALLTTTMSVMADTVRMIHESGFKGKILSSCCWHGP